MSAEIIWTTQRVSYNRELDLPLERLPAFDHFAYLEEWSLGVEPWGSSYRWTCSGGANDIYMQGDAKSVEEARELSVLYCNKIRA